MPYVSIFENFQSYCHIQNQNSRIIEFHAKNKRPLNLRPKISYVDVFIMQLEENIVILKFSPLCPLKNAFSCVLNDLI